MILYLGILLFAGPHLYSLFWPRSRDAFKTQLGDGAYKGLYSVASLAGLVLLGMAYMRGRAGPSSLDSVYEPFYTLKHPMMLLVLLGFILISAAHGKGYIKKFVKHPMSLGFALWATGHLLVNGEKAVVYIFATILIVSVLDIVLSTARGKVPDFEPRIRSDVIAVIAGFAIFFVAMFGFHPYVLNIPVAG
jgi:uncharacterized membrane protein